MFRIMCWLFDLISILYRIAPASTNRSEGTRLLGPQKFGNIHDSSEDPKQNTRKITVKFELSEFCYFWTEDRLNMLFWSAPTQGKYSQPFLKMSIFGPRRTFFQNLPKPIQKHPQTTPRHFPRHPKHDKKITPNRPLGGRNQTRHLQIPSPWTTPLGRSRLRILAL